MYHILMKRQIIRLSNDMSNIKMDKKKLLRIEKMRLFRFFLDQLYLT